MNLLCTLLKLSPDKLKEILFWYLRKKGLSPINEDGYLYAEGEIPVLLVAHMDTVFAEPPKFLYYSSENDMLYNPEGGLGGDDRCGVFAILILLEKFKPHILFTEGEEKGGIGARKAAKNLPKPNVKYIIEFDRRGSNDCVFYDCGNKEFAKYVETFGFKTNYGSFTDISVLGEKWDIAAVNLSSGYYYEHTKNEYVIFGELQKTIERAEAMIREIEDEKVPYFDHQTKKYYYPYTNYGSTNYRSSSSSFEDELSAYIAKLNGIFDDSENDRSLVFGETRVPLPKQNSQRSNKLSELLKRLTADLGNKGKGL